MIEYKKTDRFCEYRNMHFADITEIYYNGWCVGGKFYDKWRTAGQIWYILECDVDFIPECEKKFGYGWFLEDRGYVICPEDGSLSVEQIEQELIPQVCLFILNHVVEYLDAKIKEKDEEYYKAGSDLIQAYANHISDTPYTDCDKVLERVEKIKKELDEMRQDREKIVEALTPIAS